MNTINDAGNPIFKLSYINGIKSNRGYELKNHIHYIVTILLIDNIASFSN